MGAESLMSITRTYLPRGKVGGRAYAMGSGASLQAGVLLFVSFVFFEKDGYYQAVIGSGEICMDGDTTHTACMETKRSESGDVWIACAWHTDARTHLAGVGRDP